MRVLLLVIGMCVGGFGVLSYALASNAIQQASALLVALVGAVFFVGAAVVSAIGELRDSLK